MSDRYAYLVYVDALDNHNKYYEITENSDRSIDVKYGRVGGSAMSHHYRPYEKDFDSLKGSKERKGYTDVTALHETKVVNSKMEDELSYRKIDNEEIDEMVTMLVKSAREFMRNNYTVKASEITQKMVDEAERDIQRLTDIANGSQVQTWRFNEVLQELFTDIPRKMGNVADCLAQTSDDFQKIIEREQDMLDNVKGQVNEIKRKQSLDSKDETVLEAYGLAISPVTYREEDRILSHLGMDYNGAAVENRYVRAFKVENSETRQNYEAFKKDNGLTNDDVRLFYHGSKTENWWSIMKQGLSLNPNASVTGKMFGNGLYFASECRKSLNYMDTVGSAWNDGMRESGFMAIYAVALGKCYKPRKDLPTTFGVRDLPSGCLSVYADKNMTKLKNDEYVIYRPEQCTIKYLVEMTKQDVREKVYNLDRSAVYLKSGLKPLQAAPEGVKAELDISALPTKCRSEFLSKVTDSRDKLYITYNEKSDRIGFENDKGKDIVPLALTGDDMAFLCREFKKSFAESEAQWKSTVRDMKERQNENEAAKPKRKRTVKTEEME